MYMRGRRRCALGQLDGLNQGRKNECAFLNVLTAKQNLEASC